MGIHEQGLGCFTIASFNAAFFYVKNVTGDLYGLVFGKLSLYSSPVDQLLQRNGIVEILRGGEIEAVFQRIQVEFFGSFPGCTVNATGFAVYSQITEILLRVPWALTLRIGIFNFSDTQ